MEGMTTNTIRRIGASLLVTTAAVAALSTTSPANAMKPDVISPVLDHGAATTSDTRATEQAIADCMAAHGFEYVPNVKTVTVTPVIGEEHMAVVELEGGTDPNEAIINQLSVSERVAYNLAMWGPDTEVDADGFMVSGPGNSIGADACALA
ncbi:hypothetical protein [Nocardioides sp.]|uniref:hypothetical protein n=1 Tax=Nocardioides sp. TaxID=35761 RepID=UPI0037842DB8